MSKYKNKRLHISASDIIFVFITLGLLIASALFWSNCQKTKGKFNIEQTKVDFIISAPSQEQVNEIQSRSDVNKIVPYVYKSIDIKGNKKTINTGLYIIEKGDDLDYTVFSDSLKVDFSSASVANPLYISNDLAEAAGISINDNVNISVSGADINFAIIGIYRSDYRNVGGTAIATMQNDVKSLCGENYKYGGAYISSDNLAVTKSYLDSYVGMGDLRSADEFDSDEAYQQYLENRNNKNSTELAFNRYEYVKELERRYSSSILRDFGISLAFVAGGIIILLIGLLGKSTRYTKNDVEKDIRNNFTLEQEKQMYSSYHTSIFFIYLLAIGILFVLK